MTVGHWGRDVASRPVFIDSISSKHALVALNRSWSDEIDRGQPPRACSLDGSCRRADFSTKLESVRAPMVPWMINEKPTSYVRSRGPKFPNSHKRFSEIGKASIQTDRLAEFTYRLIIPFTRPGAVTLDSGHGPPSVGESLLNPIPRFYRNSHPRRLHNRQRREFELPEIHAFPIRTKRFPCRSFTNVFH